MAVQLHDTGEEYMMKVVLDGSISRVTTATIGLYNDSTDSLTDANDLSDITTEPSDGNYARQTFSLNATDITTSQSGGDWQGTIAKQTFDTTNTTGTVDSYFIVINVQLSGDGAAADHLFWTGSLDQSYDLSNIDTFEVDADTAGASIT